MTVNLRIDRSPRHQVKDLDDIQILKLNNEAQNRLGCTVNEQVFLECPYAFVPRQILLQLSQERDSTLECFSGKIIAYPQEEMLIGYAENKIVAEEPGIWI